MQHVEITNSPFGVFARHDSTPMGPIATIAMAAEGSDGPSSGKLHPFFIKTSAFTDSEAMTHAADDAGHDSKRVKTSSYGPPQPSTSVSGESICYHTSFQNDASFEHPFHYAVPHDQPTMMNYIDPSLYSGEPVPHLLAAPSPAPIGSDMASTSAPAPASVIQPYLPVDSAPAPVPPPPKKVLKFNMKTGTLGSPPKPKPTKRNSKVVCIKYGRTPEDCKRLGDKIAQILAGTLHIQDTPAKAPESKPKKTAKNGLAQANSKSTHPFFAKEKEKRVEQQATVEKKRNTVFMSTPVSPRKPRNAFSAAKASSFGIKSAGTKVPGSKHPLWPPHGFSHIRGDEPINLPAASSSTSRLKKKSKGQTVSINSQESILGNLGRQLDINSVKRSLPKNDNVFPPPPAELRLPTRHFESGCKLAKRMRTEIQSSVSLIVPSARDMDEDDLAREPAAPAHPSIKRHWRSLFNQLSAFDQSTCESISWASKYAPATAEEVLQPGREVTILKQWLEMLRVQGVEGARDGSAKSKAEAKKKKRKSKLDGFIVDSEDESGEMNELSDPENQPASSKKRSRPSVARSLDLAGKDPSKLANTIILSGPHGSGKSAAVYAVAKELGFEIFEINSSTRRSGKDILERVGDMTRNHLVQHGRAEPAADSADTTESDINSGKQGMMTTFFKPKAPMEKKTKSKTKSHGKTDTTTKSSSKSQKQSLILLEEVDILYEEDKQFWASLQTMMSQSKRPFILTCNDESSVPIQTLDLHGIFRFLPPPETLAVDACLLIAANEGHALKRTAVSSLYKSRDYDLRATIADLQFWCQIGVGDRRGGHDWFYLRWPKGIDVDKKGDVVRVVSEDTYQAGMGWLSRDRVVAAPDTQAMEQESAEQAWQFWHQDLTDWHHVTDLKAFANAKLGGDNSRQQTVSILSAYDNYYEGLSCADICARGVLATDLDEIVDPTLPEMPERAKDDFIIARTLLEADPLQPHFCSRVAISSSISALALSSLRKIIADCSPAAAALPSDLYDEQKTTSILERSFAGDHSRLTRYDVAVAFDPIAVSPKAVATMSLDPSVFDRNMSMIIEDVAPWVRGIVYYEDQLMQDRQHLNELLGDSGGPGRRKRMRTTRSAYSALEGGERRSTRRERYFGDCLSTESVMYTGGSGWQQVLPARERGMEQEEYPASSPMSIESTEMTG